MLNENDRPPAPLTPPPTTDDEQPLVVHGPVHGGMGSDQMARGVLAHHPAAPVRGGPATVPEAPILGDANGSAIPDVGPSPGDKGVAPSGAPALQPRRAHSLDALRGLFLVLMTLGFAIHGTYFPDWMYHRQFPPPGDMVDVAGIAWRDLAYAAFIFTMAAALPITLSRRIERGETEIATLFAVVRRFALLFVFALLIAHSNTFFIGYTQLARVVALVGFVIMFMLFTRRRQDWNKTVYRTVKTAGWIAAVAFLAFSPLVYGGTFTPERRDDIIAGLAFAALSGSIVWYFTRENLNARLLVLVGAVALYLGARSEGWVQQWWWTSPAPWLFRPANLSLLAVVIPGTIAGDLLLRWMRTSSRPGEPSGQWSSGRLVLLSLVGVVVAPVIVIGLYNRWVLATTQTIIVICLAGASLTWRPATSSEHLLQRLFLWSTLWLMLGVFLEPAEGGIRKVPETLSYFFTVTGVTMMLLVTMVALVDLLGRRALVRPFIDVGNNPMLCYVLFTVFLNSLFELIPGLRPVLRASPAESFLRSVIVTVLVVVIVQAFTRKRIFWRT